MEQFTEFLRSVAPYVVVVGSFGRNEETEDSDIDCFLRARPPQEVDPEISNESYMPEILEIIEKYGYFTDSVIVGHIAVERQAHCPRMVEIATYYRIPHDTPIFYRELYGVSMLCARDDKNSDYEMCYDYSDWNDDIGDMEIKYPLPKIENKLSKNA